MRTSATSGGDPCLPGHEVCPVDVLAQLLARHCAICCLFNGDASMHRDRSRASLPLRDHRRRNAQLCREL